MHHGYYEPGKRVSNQQAQIDMIERSLEWAGVTDVKNVSTGHPLTPLMPMPTDCCQQTRQQHPAAVSSNLGD